MGRSFFARAVFVSGLLFLLADAGPLARAAEEIRTWSDSTGKYKVEAEFKAVADGKVTLVRKEGGLLEIELGKLSADDQAYIAERLKEADENPFKVKSDDASPADDAEMDRGDNDSDDAEQPGAPENRNGGSASRRKSRLEKKAALPALEPDWSQAEIIPSAATSATWNLPVSSVAAGGTPLKARAIPTPPLHEGEGLTATVVSASLGHALVGYTSSRREKDNFFEEILATRVALCDLSKGKTVGDSTMSGKYVPIAVNEGGTRALVREDQFGFDDKALELWDVTSKAAKQVVRWWPGPLGEKGGEIRWAAFLGDDRVVTISQSGALVIWKSNTGEPISYMQIGGECQPAVTADRRYLIFGANQRIGVLDLDKSEVVAEIGTEPLHSASFCLSPDGTRLACVSGSNLTIRKLSDGTPERQIPMAEGCGLGELLWPHEKFLLLGKTRVFDIENQLVLWTYQGAERVCAVGPLCMFSIRGDQNRAGALVLASVPPPILQQVLAKAMEEPDFFVLAPGTTVKLNVDGLPDADEREKIRASLAEKLKAVGAKIGDGSIELVATVESKSVDQAYTKLGFFPPTSPQVETYHLQEFTSRLAFVYKEKPAWQMQTVSSPYHIQAKPGQTIEAALHETEKPNYEFFAGIVLPRKLMKPMPGGMLGSSTVTSAGVQ